MLPPSFALTPYLFESTRPRRGATRFCDELLAAPEISIHAPTRGATPLGFKTPFVVAVSIHAPTRGATWRPKALTLALE